MLVIVMRGWVMIMTVYSLSTRTCLVKNKITERQLLSFIVKRERLQKRR